MTEATKRITKALLDNYIEVFTESGKWSLYEVQDLNDILTVANETNDSEFKRDLLEGLNVIVECRKNRAQDKDDKAALLNFITLLNN